MESVHSLGQADLRLLSNTPAGHLLRGILSVHLHPRTHLHYGQSLLVYNYWGISPIIYFFLSHRPSSLLDTLSSAMCSHSSFLLPSKFRWLTWRKLFYDVPLTETFITHGRMIWSLFVNILWCFLINFINDHILIICVVIQVFIIILYTFLN